MSRAVRGHPFIPLDGNLGRSAALVTIAGENFDLVHIYPLSSYMYEVGWGNSIFFGSRFCLGLAVAVPDAPWSALAGCVVGMRI